MLATNRSMRKGLINACFEFTVGAQHIISGYRRVNRLVCSNVKTCSPVMFRAKPVFTNGQAHPAEAPGLLDSALLKLLSSVLSGEESSLVVSGAPVFTASSRWRSHCAGSKRLCPVSQK